MKKYRGIVLLATCLLTGQRLSARNDYQATLRNVTIQKSSAYHVVIKDGKRSQTLSKENNAGLGFIVPSVQDDKDLKILVRDKNDKQVSFARLQDLGDEIYLQTNLKVEPSISKHGQYCSNYGKAGSCYQNNACEWDTARVTVGIEATVNDNGQIFITYKRPVYNGMADGRDYCKEASHTQSGSWNLPKNP